MSENSKELRELLIELEYGELDKLEAAEVQSRIDADPSMKAMQVAFQAVRAEMQAGEEIEVRPARIAFVAMPGQVRASSSGSMLWKGLAVAASFAFGILLAAAAVNTAGLWPAAPGEGLTSLGGAPVQTTPISQMSEADVAGLENFLDARYARRDAASITPVSTMSREQLQPIIDDMMAEREEEREEGLRQIMRQMLAVAEDQQRQEIQTMMAGMFQTFDVQRTNDLLTVADELGILQQNTGAELQRNSDAIQYLFTRVSTGREQDDD